MSGTLLRMEGICKSFYGVRALDDVNFALREGEIHALCGENGAGKSTLMKVLAGNHACERGTLYIRDEPVTIKNPLAAERLGVAIVYQELSLSPTVSIAENIFMGREPLGKGGLVDKKRMRAAAREYLEVVGLELHPDTLLRLLSVAQMQLVQIAKALSLDARILILDEPCSSLGQEDSDNLFRILDSLRGQGIGIVYIDHRMENIFRLCDRVTVLRDGCTVGTREIGDVTRDELIQMMVGRPVSGLFPKTSVPDEEVVFEVAGLSNHKCRDVAFQVRRGEVFGLGGLVGAGRSEILRAVFGVDAKDKGARVRIDGRPVRIRSPGDAIRAGVAYVPEDRKLEGLCLFRSVVFNTVLVFLRLFCRGVFVSDKLARQATARYIEELNIKVGDAGGNVAQLSGGNQQKVVLAKWLLMDSMKVLMLDEPTRGIDVGAKHEIYKLIDELAGKGVAVIVITSELPELMGLCDRIAVVSDGGIRGELRREEFSQEAIMDLCV